MKKQFLIIGILILHFNSRSQTNPGFRFYTPPKKELHCISHEQHISIEKKLKKGQSELTLAGKLKKINPKGLMTTTFIWPVEQTNGLNDYGVHFTANFVDLNSGYPNQITDYNCGSRSYDLNDGYNHAGTDICLWPFEWYKMDSSQVKIVAAASGTITGKDDGHTDHNCGGNITDDWNAVYIQHADGSVAWYGHMKNGSLTGKTVGQTVAAGEYLGLIGSSGFSSGPHLHFEVYDPGNNLIDPFAGSCNSLNSTSWWASQRPYYDSGINALRTQSATAIFPTCPQIETPHEQTRFCAGQEVYFAAYYRDQQVGQTSQYKVFRPDNSLWQQWNNTNTTYYNASYWDWSYILPLGAPSGTWKFQVVYDGQTYERFFDVEVAPSVSVSGATLTANNTGAVYQWINCENGNSTVLGETNQNFTPSANGSYAVIVTQSNCSDTSACYTVNVTGMEGKTFSQRMYIHPNPFKSETTITFDEEQQQMVIKITDVLGKVIKTINFSGKQLVLEKGEINKGVYFIHLVNSKNQVICIRKIILQ